MKLHPTITADRVMEAVERAATSLDNPGFCIAGGDEVEGDANEHGLAHVARVCPCWENEVTRARAAIAKAEGRS